MLFEVAPEEVGDPGGGFGPDWEVDVRGVLLSFNKRALLSRITSRALTRRASRTPTASPRPGRYVSKLPEPESWSGRPVALSALSGDLSNCDNNMGLPSEDALDTLDDDAESTGFGSRRDSW